jgi:hypothetical protein
MVSRLELTLNNEKIEFRYYHIKKGKYEYETVAMFQGDQIKGNKKIPRRIYKREMEQMFIVYNPYELLELRDCLLIYTYCNTERIKEVKKSMIDFMEGRLNELNSTALKFFDSLPTLVMEIKNEKSR